MLLILLFLSCNSSPNGPSQSFDLRNLPPQVTAAFTNVNVIPMDTERVIPAQTVIVENGRITKIGPTANITVPQNATLYDGTDRYLMPGLIDCHVHIYNENDLLLFLANGITTVRDLNGHPGELQWRTQIDQGNLLGPTLYVSSPIIDGDPPVFGGNIPVNTEAEARAVVNQQKSSGYDFIKVYSALTIPAYDALAQAAQSVGLKIVGHVPGRVGITHALEMGHYSIEHLYGYARLLQDPSQPNPGGFRRLYGAVDIDESLLPDLAAATRDAGAWNCPTLIVLDRWVPPNEGQALMTLPELRYVSPGQLASWNPATNFLVTDGYLDNSSAALRAQGRSVRRTIVKGLHDAGAGLILGSDAGTLYVGAGFSIHTELQNLIETGLTPYQVLKMGTHNAAVFLEAENVFGTVAVGKRADLILLEKNPLENVAHVQNPIGVMVKGRWLSKDAIQEQLDQLLASYGR